MGTANIGDAKTAAIIVFGFIMGIVIMGVIYDRVAYYKAKFICNSQPVECGCKVEGSMFYYRAVWYTRFGKYEKEF